MATSTKTPSATPASIEARRAAVAAAKARLQQTQVALAAAERAAQAQAQAKARKEDTRRKVLAGAMLLTASETDQKLSTYINRLADKVLTRADERALFGLDPLPAPAAAPAPAAPDIQQAGEPEGEPAAQAQPQDDASTQEQTA
jgi:hypothetical protein